MPEEIPPHRNEHDWAPAGDLVGALLQKTFYGHTVGEVLALALALEQMLDAILVKGLIKDDPAIIDLVIDKLLGPIGRERKFALLRPVLQHQGVHDSEQICVRVRQVFDLRDKIAHSAMMEASAGAEHVELVGYRRGRLQSHHLTPDAAAKVLKEGAQALQDLLPYATV